MSREFYGALIGVLTLLITLTPLPFFVIAISVLSALMAREIALHLGIREFYPSALFAPPLFFLHHSLGGLYTALLSLTYGYKRWDLDAFFKAFFVLFYTGFFPSFLILLKSESTYYLIVFFLTVWSNDVAAYYLGKKFGKTPFFPKLSPKKTYEGFLGGILIGTLVFVSLSEAPLKESVLIGLITLVVGVMGDLFKSFIKRQLGIKDFSNTLGGHGGFVDRFDAVVFSAPVFYWLMFRI